MMTTKRKVVIIGTGGTIAGVAASGHTTVGYSDAQLRISDLLQAVPGIEDVADVKLHNFCNLGSEYMDSATLWQLAKLAQSLLAENDADGIVITHGSDTIEESALFLDLVYGGQSPIVLVPAMRPASALSADGPFNILQAVALAAHPASFGRGIMITWSNHIGGAAYTTKSSSRAVDSFDASDRGLLGILQDTQPIFYMPPARLAHQGIFSRILSTQPTNWPKICILYGHQEMNADLLQAAVNCGAEGIIVACTGDGTLPLAWSEKIADLERHDIPVVRGSHVWSTYVAPRKGCITAGLFNPQKARIVLQLAVLTFGGGASSQLQQVLDPLIGGA